MAASNIDKVGFFDSKMVFPNIKVTPKRKVKLYEIELFTETAGTTVIDGRGAPDTKRDAAGCKAGTIRHSILHFQGLVCAPGSIRPSVNLVSRQTP